MTETVELKVKQKKTPKDKVSSSKLKKIIFYIIGYISVALGLIGLIFPILPTTPFLLLAAACFAGNSEKTYNWLVNNKIFGKVIRDYREGKGLSVKVKAYSLFFLWLTIFLSILVISILWVQILLLVIASVVSLHVILIKPKKKD
jgi:uncharacterized membrane protein YbaN (DUF454 family)